MKSDIINEYFSFLNEKAFPCIGAKVASGSGTIKCMVAGHLDCPSDDETILDFLYQFVDVWRQSSSLYNSAAVIFTEPRLLTEHEFETCMWHRLQALADLDSRHFIYDRRVSSDPGDSTFSFSLKEEALYIIGLHSLSSRKARQFKYPTFVFNPHAQFEELKKRSKFESLKAVVRKRDILYSGSVNPMLADFGSDSEARQYSGANHISGWQCPLIIKDGKNRNNSAT